jgi:glycosyltransferase involved in cell wall biosynthesis
MQNGPFRQAVIYLVKAGTDVSGLVNPLRQLGLFCQVMSGCRIFDVRQFLAVRRFVRENKVCILHCHDAKADVYGFLLRLIQPSLKLVSTLHGWTEKTRRGRFYSRLDKVVLRRFDAVIAVSEHTAKIAREKGVQRVSVVHNGIDPKEWNPGLPEGPRQEGHPFAVGFVGRISAEKGPLEFVETAHAVFLKKPDSRFVVIGEGPDLPAMKTAVAEAGLSGNFDFRGYHLPEALKRAYPGLDVLVLPSRCEGLPMTILEAFTMGVCVTAFSVGGIPEVVIHGHNGLLAPPGNVTDLAAQILALRQDSCLSARLRINAKADVASHFSVQAQVRKLEAVYRNMLQADPDKILNSARPTR